MDVSVCRFESTERGYRFKPGVLKRQFFLLLRYLKSQSENNDQADETEIITKESLFSYNRGTYRKIEYFDEDGKLEDTVFQFKRRLETIDTVGWNYRISGSMEHPIINEDDLPGEVDFGRSSLIRHKERHRFNFFSSENNPLEGAYFDLTITTEDRGGRSLYQKYEVEIEKILKSNLTTSKLVPIIKATMLLMSESTQSIRIEGQEVSGSQRLFSQAERETVAFHFNELFHKQLQSGVLYNYKNKPTSVKISDLMDPGEFAITIKYDGVRFFLFFTTTDTYLLDPPFTMIKIGAVFPELDGTLIDGELMLRSQLPEQYEDEEGLVLFAFDILFYQGKDVRNENLIERLKYLRNAIFDDSFSQVVIHPGGSYKLSHHCHQAQVKTDCRQQNQNKKHLFKSCSPGYNRKTKEYG